MAAMAMALSLLSRSSHNARSPFSLRTDKHTDKFNNPPSYIGLGSYTGGELVFTDKKVPHYGAHNIKNKFLKFDGSTEHYVKPSKGEHYTIVYYRWS